MKKTNGCENVAEIRTKFQSIDQSPKKTKAHFADFSALYSFMSHKHLNEEIQRVYKWVYKWVYFILKCDFGQQQAKINVSFDLKISEWKEDFWYRQTEEKRMLAMALLLNELFFLLKMEMSPSITFISPVCWMFERTMNDVG